MATLSFTLAGLTGSADPVFLPKLDPASASDATTPGIAHYIGFVQVRSLPAGLPNKPNLRDTNLKSAVSKDVRASLLKNDGEFHLKNKGITIVASRVRREEESLNSFVVDIDEEAGDGILDGGHTYKLIQEAVSDGFDVGSQWVQVSIRVNVAEDLRAKMAEGLNKTAAVSVGSLANRLGEFDWLKNTMETESLRRIAWRQNDSGDKKVEELIAELYAVNYHAEDNWVSYSSRAKTLTYLRDPHYAFPQHAVMCVDTFKLYERIQHDFADWAEQTLGKRSVESKRKPVAPIFATELPARNTRLARAVALPVLAAFQCLVTPHNGLYVYDRTYSEIVALLDAAKDDLQDKIQQLWERGDIAGDPGAFGKKTDVWIELHNVLVAWRGTVRAVGPRSASPPVAPILTRKDRNYLSADEVIGMWGAELEELENDRDVLLEQLKVASSSGESQSLKDAIRSNETLLERLRGAILYAEEGNLGVCGQCGGDVEDDRVLDSITTKRCVSCATS